MSDHLSDSKTSLFTEGNTSPTSRLKFTPDESFVQCKSSKVRCVMKNSIRRSPTQSQPVYVRESCCSWVHRSNTSSSGSAESSSMVTSSSGRSKKGICRRVILVSVMRVGKSGMPSPLGGGKRYHCSSTSRVRRLGAIRHSTGRRSACVTAQLPI